MYLKIDKQVERERVVAYLCRCILYIQYTYIHICVHAFLVGLTGLLMPGLVGTEPGVSLNGDGGGLIPTKSKNNVCNSHTVVNVCFFNYIRVRIS